MLSSFILSSFLLAISPGPDNVYVSILTSRYGKIAGFSFLIGLLAGCIIHTIFLAFGLNVLILEYDFMFLIIKYLGVCYIIYLSYQVHSSAENENLYLKTQTNQNIIKNFKKGIFMNILNPKVFIFFALFFPNFLFSNEISIKLQLLTLGLIFISITFFVFGIIILFSEKIHEKVKSNNSFKIFAKYFNIIILWIIASLILFSENNINLLN